MTLLDIYVKQLRFIKVSALMKAVDNSERVRQAMLEEVFSIDCGVFLEGKRKPLSVSVFVGKKIDVVVCITPFLAKGHRQVLLCASFEDCLKVLDALFSRKGFSQEVSDSITNGLRESIVIATEMVTNPAVELQRMTTSLDLV